MTVNCEFVYADDDRIARIEMNVLPRADETVSLHLVENGEVVERLFVVTDIIHVVSRNEHYVKIYVEDID